MSVYGELTSGRDYALTVIASAVLRPKCGHIPQELLMDRSNYTSFAFATDIIAQDCSKGWYF